VETSKRGHFYGKVLIEGQMECLTGLHIGGNQDAMGIGGIDAPVVRDPMTREPYIPGSSLKGKLRSLFERSLAVTSKEANFFNSSGGKNVYRHECADRACQVCRLFGSINNGGGKKSQERNGAASDAEGKNQPSRILVRDLRLSEESRILLHNLDSSLYMTEWKFENGLDRVTSVANPRQLERVPRGAKFDFQISYTVSNPSMLVEDLANIQLYLRVLEDDYLGGHGSRGYGQVKFDIRKLVAKNRQHYLDGTESPSTQNLSELMQYFSDKG
jgi:CRISPR-associated protein Csm3